MSLDSKFAAIYYGLAIMTMFLLCAMWVIRRIVGRGFAAEGHDFYVAAYGHEPVCASCPFSRHCPYKNRDEVCKFTKITTP